MHPLNTSLRHSSTGGFTLIEILVVIVILGFSISLVVVNFSAGGAEKKLEEETHRLQQLLRFAHEQSVVRADEYGIRFYQTGYRFMLYNEETKSWAGIDKDKLLRSRTFPEEFELDLYIEQVPVELLNSQDDEPEIEEEEEENKLATALSDKNKTQEEQQEKIKPQVFLLSSSELEPPFEVHLRMPANDLETVIQGLPQGEYELLKDEDE